MVTSPQNCYVVCCDLHMHCLPQAHFSMQQNSCGSLWNLRRWGRATGSESLRGGLWRLPLASHSYPAFCLLILLDVNSPTPCSHQHRLIGSSLASPWGGLKLSGSLSSSKSFLPWGVSVRYHGHSNATVIDMKKMRPQHGAWLHTHQLLPNGFPASQFFPDSTFW